MLIKRFAAMAMAGTMLVCCAGCGGDEDDKSWMELEGYNDEADDEDVEDVVTSTASYMKYVSDSVYKYLYIYEMSDGTITAQVLLPGKEAAGGADGSVSSELHGVTVSYRIESGENSPINAVSSAYKTEQASLGADSSIQNVQVNDLLTADDWAIQEIDYEREKNDTAYQCYAYIKADSITDDAVIVTLINVDSSASDATTAALLAEVLDAAGIVVESDEDADQPAADESSGEVAGEDEPEQEDVQAEGEGGDA